MANKPRSGLFARCIVLLGQLSYPSLLIRSGGKVHEKDRNDEAETEKDDVFLNFVLATYLG